MFSIIRSFDLESLRVKVDNHYVSLAPSTEGSSGSQQPGCPGWPQQSWNLTSFISEFLVAKNSFRYRGTGFDQLLKNAFRLGICSDPFD